MYEYFFIYFFMLFFTLFLFFSHKVSRNFLNPVTIIFFAVIVESIFPIIYLLINGGYTRIVGAQYDLYAHYIYASLLMLFSLSYFVFLHFSNFANNLSVVINSKLTETRPFSSKVEIFILLFASISIAPGSIKLISLMLSVGIDVYFSNRIILFSGLGFLLASFKISQLAGLIVIANQLVLYRNQGKKLNYFNFLFGLFLAIFPAILMGSRSQIFIPIVGIITIGLLIKFKGSLNILKLIKPISLGLCLLVVAINLGAVREAVMSNKLDSIGEVQSKGLVHGLAFTYGSSENLLWLIQNDEPREYLYGYTYLATFLGFIPRAIWKDKPLGGGPVMQNLIVSGSYDQNSENISSTTTGILAELYLNFGPIGMLLGPGLFLLLLSGIFRLVFYFDGVVFIALYSAVIFRVFGYVNAEFFGVTSHIVTLIFSAYLLKMVILFFCKRIKL
ncbi:oligosaccharide repeat unit polymerase [Shewanella electrodiphila]|uniref:Oligosaccharide repeat unit polymerase n=1 Tax=Shewanella electrodiphila TaxID=934143 RepID=A0ABT0KKJ8_9GAMM|nr:O-antigen polymerase [Shewanella electrodiphila]MCL1044144.1 oligosaccharide repeat unit polymerase [Shewanella electrodiphila]